MTASVHESTNEFRTFLGKDWEQWVAEYPEYATYVGRPEHNDRWTDDSAAGVDRRVKHLEASLAHLRSIRPEQLPGSERLNYTLYRELFESAQAGVKLGDDPFPFRYTPRSLWMPLNQLEGVHLEPVDILVMQPHGTVSDFDHILARLTRLPTLVEQNLALLESGRKAGRTPPKICMRGVPDQVAKLVPEDPKGSALLRSVREFPLSISEADRERIVGEAERVYRAQLRPVYRRLQDYLTNAYLPFCRESIAASDLPNGKAVYESLVRWHTTSSKTPTEIHEIGLAEIRRIKSEMETVMRSAGFSGSFRDFLEFLRTDARFYYRSSAELLDGYRIVTKKIDPELARLFRRLPRLTYGILPVPDFKAPEAPAAYYQGGSPVAGRPGYFFVNTYDLKARPQWSMDALALHEAVPGHHLQLALAQELENVPEFRLHSSQTAFVEGWGLYAEGLGEELGCYRDPYSKFGKLSADAWRAARLVVDTGMHTLGWSREQAIEYMRENTAESDQDVLAEVDRYIVWPGQALAYKMGQLKIQELRSRAESKLGTRFDVRAFHDSVLTNGAVPLGILESAIEAWIESHGSDKSSASTLA